MSRLASDTSVGSVDLEGGGSKGAAFNTDNVVRYLNGDFKIEQHEDSHQLYLTSHEKAGSLAAVALYNYFPEKSDYLPIDGDDRPEFGLSKGDRLHIVDMNEEEAYVLIRFIHQPGMGEGWVPGQFVSTDGQNPFFKKSKEKRIHDERKLLAQKLGKHQFRTHEGAHDEIRGRGHTAKQIDTNSHHFHEHHEVQPKHGSKESSPRDSSASNGASNPGHGITWKPPQLFHYTQHGAAPRHTSPQKQQGRPEHQHGNRAGSRSPDRKRSRSPLKRQDQHRQQEHQGQNPFDKSSVFDEFAFLTDH